MVDPNDEVAELRDADREIRARLAGHKMAGAELHAARMALAKLWRLEDRLGANEFGRLLRLQGLNPGLAVLEMERGRRPVSGPVAVAVLMMLAGAKPPDFDAEFEPTPRGGKGTE